MSKNEFLFDQLDLAAEGLYHRVVRLLRRGENPSKAALSRQLGISRTTLDGLLTVLAAHNLLRYERHSGFQVAAGVAKLDSQPQCIASIDFGIESSGQKTLENELKGIEDQRKPLGSAQTQSSQLAVAFEDSQPVADLDSLVLLAADLIPGTVAAKLRPIIASEVGGALGAGWAAAASAGQLAGAVKYAAGEAAQKSRRNTYGLFRIVLRAELYRRSVPTPAATPNANAVPIDTTRTALQLTTVLTQLSEFLLQSQQSTRTRQSSVILRRTKPDDSYYDYLYAAFEDQPNPSAHESASQAQHRTSA